MAVKMTLMRRLEVFSGLATALLGAAVTLNMLRTDYQTMLRLNEDFPVIQELSVACFYFFFQAYSLLWAHTFMPSGVSQEGLSYWW